MCAAQPFYAVRLCYPPNLIRSQDHSHPKKNSSSHTYTDTHTQTSKHKYTPQFGSPNNTQHQIDFPANINIHTHTHTQPEFTILNEFTLHCVLTSLVENPHTRSPLFSSMISAHYHKRSVGGSIAPLDQSNRNRSKPSS